MAGGRSLHGKEGGDGSSPSEGFKIPGNRGFFVACSGTTEHLLSREGVASRETRRGPRKPLAQTPCCPGSSTRCYWRFVGDRFWGRPTPRRCKAVKCQSYQRPEAQSPTSAR